MVFELDDDVLLVFEFDEPPVFLLSPYLFNLSSSFSLNLLFVFYAFGLAAYKIFMNISMITIDFITIKN